MDDLFGLGSEKGPPKAPNNNLNICRFCSKAFQKSEWESCCTQCFSAMDPMKLLPSSWVSKSASEQELHSLLVRASHRPAGQFSVPNRNKTETKPKVEPKKPSTLSNNNTWNCTTCTFANSFKLASCGMCGTIRPGPPKWSCSVCTLINPSKVAQCSACGNYRTGENTQTDDDPILNWICPVCTFDNEAGSTRCGACDGPALKAEKLSTRERADIVASLSNQEEERKQQQKFEESVRLLKKRLDSLSLEQLEMEDDGNCLFRAVSYQLYRTQKYHPVLRRVAVQQLKTHTEQYRLYFDGDDSLQKYLQDMSKAGCWGDEISLKAISDSFGMQVHVISSNQDNWLLSYAPDSNLSNFNRHMFISYIHPVHYNSVTIKGQVVDTSAYLLDREDSLQNDYVKLKQKLQDVEANIRQVQTFICTKTTNGRHTIVKGICSTCKLTPHADDICALSDTGHSYANGICNHCRMTDKSPYNTYQRLVRDHQDLTNKMNAIDRKLDEFRNQQKQQQRQQQSIINNATTVITPKPVGNTVTQNTVQAKPASKPSFDDLFDELMRSV